MKTLRPTAARHSRGAWLEILRATFVWCGMSPNERAGGALITVVILSATLTLILGGLTSASHQRMRIMRAESDRAKALAIAEAGVSTGFGLLAANPALADQANPVVTHTNFAGGAYEVHLASPAPDLLLVTAHGRFRGQRASSAATVAVQSEPVGGGGTPDAIMGPFGAVMLLAGGNLTLSGGINVGLGQFGAHCNGNMLLSGGPNLAARNLSAFGTMTFSGNPQVHLSGGSGRAHANGLIALAGTINAAQITSVTRINGNWGTTTSATNIAPTVVWPNYFNPLPPVTIQAIPAVQTVALPELDADAFRSHAQANTYYYNGNQTIDRAWLTADILRRTGLNVNNNQTLVAPQGGVLFINGNVSIASDMRVEGMVIATGNVTIGGAARLNNTTPYPGLVSVNGNITLGGGANGPTLNGWIYAMNGSVTAGGGASGCGIVAAQNITVTAGYAIGDFQGSPFVSPGQTAGGGGGGNTNDVSVELVSWTR